MNFGSALPECGTGIDSNYVQIFFDCLPTDDSAPVGFTAIFNANVNVTTNQVFPFGSVLSNFGGHYNARSYSFVCPTSGVYSFTCNFVTDNSLLNVGLYRNNASLVLSAGHDANELDTGSMSVVTQCNAGDVVWVNALSPGKVTNSLQMTHFSGFLIQPF